MRYLNFPRTRTIQKSALASNVDWTFKRQLLSQANQLVQYCVILPLGINSIWMFFFLCRTASTAWVWHYSTFCESVFVSAFIRLKRITHQTNNKSNKWCKKPTYTQLKLDVIKSKYWFVTILHANQQKSMAMMIIRAQRC